MIAALAIVSVLLAISIVLNVLLGLAASSAADTAAEMRKSAEMLARAERSPSGKLTWPPRRDGAV